MKNLILICFILIVTVFISGCLQQSTTAQPQLAGECINKTWMAESSDYILEGTVGKVEARWNETKTSVFTYVDFSIEKYIKGEPFEDNKIVIISQGGKIGEKETIVEDQPTFVEGKKIRIYIKEHISGLIEIIKDGKQYSIICQRIGIENT